MNLRLRIPLSYLPCLIIGILFFARGAMLLALAANCEQEYWGVVYAGVFLLLLASWIFKPRGVNIILLMLFGPLPLPIKCLWIYLFWCALTTLWSPAIDSHSDLLILLSQMVVLATILAIAHITPIEKLVKTAFWGYIIGVCSTCIIIMYYMLSMGYFSLHVNTFAKVTSNYVGVITGLAALMVLHLLVDTEKKWLQIVLVILLMLLIFSLVDSVSKTAITSLVICMIIFLYSSQQFSFKKPLVLLLTLSIALAIPMLSQSLNGPYDYTTLDGRTVQLWQPALSAMAENFPLLIFGHGTNSVPLLVGFMHLHNEVLNVLYAYGLVGLLLLLGIYITYLRQILYILRHDRQSAMGLVCLLFLLHFLIKGTEEASPASLIFNPELLCLTSLWMSARWNHYQAHHFGEVPLLRGGFQELPA